MSWCFACIRTKNMHLFEFMDSFKKLGFRRFVTLKINSIFKLILFFDLTHSLLLFQKYIFSRSDEALFFCDA